MVAATATIEPTVIPAAASLTYAIEEGDTLLVIAYRFGVSVDDLLSANPEVIPRCCRSGTS